MICRNCGAGLEEDRIDQSLRIITCSHCGSLHDFPGASLRQFEGELDSNNSDALSPKPERQEVALPSRFKVHRTAGGMEIRWPVGGVFQGFVLLAIAAGFSYIAVTQGMYFLMPVSIGLVYFAAVRTFNKHIIRTDSSSLHITQRPLPWLGARNLSVSDIEQLFSTEYETRQEKGSDGDHRIEVQKNYQLSAHTRTSQSVRLLRGLSDPLQALWLEQEIERALGIRDKRVAGEHWQQKRS